MKVFLSWSGERSKSCAELLADWLPQCIQAVEPVISSNIETGARWTEHLAKALSESVLGVICITRENVKSPWLLFEAGALSNKPNVNVCTVLLDMSPQRITGPLAQFQSTSMQRDGMLKLLRTMNTKLAQCNERSLSPNDLDRIFNERWDAFETRLAELQPPPLHCEDSPPSSEHLEEILDGTCDAVRAAWSLESAVFQPEILFECCRFAESAQLWRRGEYRVPRDRYNAVLLSVYSNARISIFATCVSQYLSTWRDTLGARILNVHARGRARVTRVFRFDTRAQIDTEALRIMRLHADTANVVARVFIDEETLFDYPEGLSRDFSLTDDGEVIGITNSYGADQLEATWHFGDFTKARVLKSIRDNLLRSSDLLEDVEARFRQS